MVVLVLVTFWPHASAASGNIALEGSSRSTVQTSPGHLYALDSPAGTVLRFPLSRDGRPAPTPDGILTMLGAAQPTGLAVDRKGDMFVADGNGWAGVAEFAAGATGPQRPISVLNLAADGPDWLKMDPADRLYVHLEANPYEGIAIFAKGAHGNDPPISIVPPFYSRDLLFDYALAPSGALYVMNEASSVTVYDHPLDNPKVPDLILRPEGGLTWESNFDQTIAIDAATSQLYLQFYSSSIAHWNIADYAARPLTGTGATLDQLMFTGQCGSLSYGAAVVATVISRRYLLMSCDWTNDILIYETDRFGRRNPVGEAGRGDFQGIDEITLGP